MSFQLATMDFECKGPSREDDVSIRKPKILAHAEREVRGTVTPLPQYI